MEVSELRDLTKDGKFFRIKFVKRTDGSVREMTCRLGVQQSVDDPSYRNWDPEPKKLLTVYDVGSRGFRNIPVDNLLELKVRGQQIPLNLSADGNRGS